jgi:hypothetical protein
LADDGDKTSVVDGLKRYWLTKNVKSLDGLTGLTVAPYTSDTFATHNTTYKADNEKISTRNRLSSLNGVGGLNLLVGFTLGVLVTSVYAKISR